MQLLEKAQASIDKVIAKFQAGDLSAITRVARIQLDQAAPVNNWSLSNKVLAFMQADELDCRGFRQWQAVGRQVKKGSTAVYIVRPHTIKQTKETETEDKTICVGFSVVPVFAASSTEGDSVLPAYVPAELPPLADLAQKFQINVEYVPVNPAALGDCNTEGSKIRLGSQDTRVFFHELTHAIHAKIEGGLKGGQHTNQETIAEFSTAVLMDFYGLGDHTGNAWKYISQYADEPLLAITRAMGTVEKIMEVLLECSSVKEEK